MSCRQDESSSFAAITPNDIAQTEGQATDRRHFRDLQFRFRYTAGSGGDEGLLNRPGLVVGRDDGSVSVYDYGDGYVKTFAVDGSLATKFGGVRGSGPGEFINPTDMIGFGDGLLLTDPRQARGTLIAGTRLDKTISLGYGSARLARVGSDRLAVLHMVPGRALFTMFDTTGQVLAEFGDFAKEYSTATIGLDGNLVSVGPSFVYSPFYFDALFRYDHSGKLEFAVSGLDNPEPLRVRSFVTGDRSGQSIGSTPMINRSISFDRDLLFVYAKNASADESTGIVDVYGSQRGDYRYSFRTPTKPITVDVAGDFLFVRRDTTVAVYERLGLGWAHDG